MPPSNEPPASPEPIPGAKPKHELTTLGVLLVGGLLVAALIAVCIIVGPYYARRNERLEGERRVIRAHWDAEAELERERVLAAGRSTSATSKPSQ